MPSRTSSMTQTVKQHRHHPYHQQQRHSSSAASPHKLQQQGSADIVNASPRTKTNGNGKLDSSLALQAVLADLLNNPLKFEQSSLSLAKPKYKPINAPATTTNGDFKSASASGASNGQPKDVKSSASSTASTIASSSKLPPSSSDAGSQAPPPAKQQLKDLFPGKIPSTWPNAVRPTVAGLRNSGNTCYMNSTMQALLHTAPLTHLLLTQDIEQLKGRFGGLLKRDFDPVEALQSFTQRAMGRTAGGGGGHGSYNAVASPRELLANLKVIARTFSQGRQEDAHEWLRLLLEALQESCLTGLPPAKLEKAKRSPIAETTFVHKIFGGKLRSRVTCAQCHHNSDTFDPMLDLSLDLRNVTSVQEALQRFTAPDMLSGTEKYKCENCSRKVNAEKSFRIETCPHVLTVHLKRFTFTGSKIVKAMRFPETLQMKKEWLSDNAVNDAGGVLPSYSLYAIVHHHGGGPHSGHYVADVKSPSGKWLKANDDFIDTMSGKPNLESKSAYLLFYVRNAKDGLQQAVASSTATSSARQTMPPPPSDIRRLPQQQPQQPQSSRFAPLEQRSPLLAQQQQNARSPLGEASSSRQQLAGSPPRLVPAKQKGHGSDFLSRIGPVSSKTFHSQAAPSSSAAAALGGEDEDVGEAAAIDEPALATNGSSSKRAQDTPDGSEDEDDPPIDGSLIGNGSKNLSRKERRRQQKALQRQQESSTVKKGIPQTPYAPPSSIFRNFNNPAAAAKGGVAKNMRGKKK